MLVQLAALSCQVEGRLWIVPPRSAVWILGGTLYAIKAAGSFEDYSARSSLHTSMPACRTLLDRWRDAHVPRTTVPSR